MANFLYTAMCGKLNSPRWQCEKQQVETVLKFDVEDGISPYAISIKFGHKNEQK